MTRREGGLFAGGGIHLPGAKVTALVVAAAFAAGIAIGWFTWMLPSLLASMSADPESVPTASPLPAPSIDPSLLPSLGPILRELDDDDLYAGLTSLEYPFEGPRTFTVVPGGTNANPSGPPVRWVSIEIENGLSLDPTGVAIFVMEQLRDPRGWGANGRLQYARTDGVADYRVVFASPVTAATMCGDLVADNPSASPTPEAVPFADPTATVSPSPTPTARTCDERGIVVISIYDWAAGLDAFGEERNKSRTYQLMHRLGVLAGNPVEQCAKGIASVMVDHRTLNENCSPNPWPDPDAVNEEDKA